MGRGYESPASSVNVPETVPKAGALVVLEGVVVAHAARDAELRAITKSMLSIRFIFNLDTSKCRRNGVSY
jgi:hypothetical protein